MTTIELADGTTFEGTVGVTGEAMCLNLRRAVAQPHLLDFMDREKMHVVKFSYGAYFDLITGYDVMQYMEPKPDRTVNVWFAPPPGTEPSVEREQTGIPDVYLPK